jgi:replication factor C large subunit
MSSPPEHNNLKVKNSFLLPESFEREATGSEPGKNAISPEFSKSRKPVNCEPVVNKVSDKPENPEIKASETPKKAESKTQKTIFDF